MKNSIKNFTCCISILVGYSMCYAQTWEYEVEKGDTLYGISDHYLISHAYYKQLQNYNDISEPLQLQPGQVIKAPVEWLGNLPGSAKVIISFGDVEVIRKDKRIKVGVNDPLEAEDKLITGDDGSAVVEFSDKSVLNVFSNTSLLFKSVKQSYDGGVIKVRVVITAGRVAAEVNPGNKRGHRLEIKSPSAVTSVRGTKFRVGIEEATGNTVAEVISGNVSVSANDQNILLKEYYGTSVSRGNSPAAPVKLLSRVKIDIQNNIETKLGAIQWNEVEHAQNYRVRVSVDDQFSNIIYDKVVSTTAVSDIFFAKDGEYNVNIRAIDSKKIEGLDSMTKLTVNAEPRPPFFISPKANTSTFETKPSFSWTITSPKTKKLRFQLSNEKKFDSVLLDQEIEPVDKFMLTQALNPGDYYWSVAGIDEDGQGPFSAPMLLSIMVQPEISQKIVRSGSKSNVNLSLNTDPSISKRHIQVARDPKFESVVFEDWISEDEYSFDTLSAGSYYIRIGVEDKEQNTIVYSDAQKIIVPYANLNKVLMSFLTVLLIAL